MLLCYPWLVCPNVTAACASYFHVPVHPRPLPHLLLHPLTASAGKGRQERSWAGRMLTRENSPGKWLWSSTPGPNAAKVSSLWKIFALQSTFFNQANIPLTFLFHLICLIMSSIWSDSADLKLVWWAFQSSKLTIAVFIFRSGPFCGGMLLSSDTVLTAAHCKQGVTSDVSNFKVKSYFYQARA